jgi:hypothetical protein
MAPPPPQSSPPAIPPPEARVAIADPDQAAWEKVMSAGTRPAFADYLQGFPNGVHVQEAQLRIADLILSGSSGGKTFDGAWQTTWTCTNVGQYPGYSYRFEGEVKDGAFHGVKGVKGQPSSMVLDGKIMSDGMAAFYGEIIVGSSVVALGAARGTPSDFHALAHFDRRSGSGKRVEGRPCTLTFEKP